MSNVLELTTITARGNRIEHVGWGEPSKLRFTPATEQSLRKNIKANMPKILEAFNSEYNRILSAYVIEATAQAEQQARDNALNDTKAEAQRAARIDEENRLAKITSAGIVKRRSNVLRLDVQKLTGRFGTLGQNFGVNVKQGYTPKALSIPSFYRKVYQTISKKSDLYKLADELDATDPSLLGEQQTETKKANWRGLFENTSAPVVNEVNVAMEGEEEENVVIPTQEVQEGLTAGDIKQRSLIGQIGDELTEIDTMINSLGGENSPFNKGLVERKINLLNMLADITGVQSIAQERVTSQKKEENTTFQNLIEDILGVTEPVSKDEHDQKQDELDAYYSNPEVSEIIDNLREKQILFGLNNPENYKKVAEAEREADRRVVESLLEESEKKKEKTPEPAKPSIKTITVEPLITSEPEVIDTNKQIEVAKEEEKKRALEEEAKALEARKAEEARLAEEQALKEAKEKEERESIIMGAEEQAKILFEQNQLDELLLGAQEQAKLLNKQNELAEIYAGAEEQAKMLQTLNYFIDRKELEELRAQKAQAEKEKLAREQAEARKQEEKAEHERLVAGAQEQARMLQAQKEHDDLVEGAKEEARRLKARAEKEELVSGAQEQARMLQAQKEHDDLVAGAEEQAKMLSVAKEEEKEVTPTQADVANQIVYENATEDFIREGAAEQAILIHKANERAKVLESAKQQAKMLAAQEEPVVEKVAEKPEDLLTTKLGPNVMKLDLNDKYLSEVAEARKIKLRDVHFKQLMSSLNAGHSNKYKYLKELRDELAASDESPEYGFLTYGEQVMKKA